jgi:predicted nucleotidyltransferase
MLPDDMKKQVVSLLTERLKLRKIILFGSHAHGAPGPHSDIDILVVTDEEILPSSFEESMRSYLPVSMALRDLKRRVPVDLIVHTRPMHERFLQLRSLFSWDILERGEVLYETGD